MEPRPELAAPSVEFFVTHPGIEPPRPASDTVGGSLPGRAKQFCPPVTQASANGWWLYPPESFALRWDGFQTEVALIDESGEPTTGWTSLVGGIEFTSPVFREVTTAWAEHHQRLIDEGSEQLTLPEPEPFSLINADPRSPNTVEISLGFAARTSPGWSLLLRAVPNWQQGGHMVLDGVIETDWYRGELATVIRLQRVGVHAFHKHMPISCAQLVPQIAYRPETIAAATVSVGFDALHAPDVWDEYVTSRYGRSVSAAGPVPSGNYRRLAREAAAGRCPHTAGRESMTDGTFDDLLDDVLDADALDADALDGGS